MHNSQVEEEKKRVRLVRACGSKPVLTEKVGKAGSWVRLVRACGSKHRKSHAFSAQLPGQARKSLWIETFKKIIAYDRMKGQARKSLWIETHQRRLTVWQQKGSGS